MTDKINILIVEDEAIIAMDLMMCLQHEGYQVVAVCNNGQEAIETFKQEAIDMILCDINILGNLDGIETMKRILNIRTIPFIYLTALGDRETLERAKQTFPSAYINKPFSNSSIQIAIEMAMNNFAYFQEQKTINDAAKDNALSQNAPKQKEMTSLDNQNIDNNLILRNHDTLFIKQTHQFVKLNVNDILYLEVENKYVTVVTILKKYVIKDTLSNVLEHIAFPQLVRVHRSFVVNLKQIEVFSDTEILIKKKSIPIGRGYKEDFIHSFRFSA
jgi:two-component system, response regulator PdtaR